MSIICVVSAPEQPQPSCEELAGLVVELTSQLEWAHGRIAELEAVAGVELVLGVALAEAQPALEHPDLLVDEGVGVGGVGELRACGQIDLDELERPAGGR